MTDKEFDEGLKAVMGDRFHYETENAPEKPVEKPTPEKKKSPVQYVPENEKPDESKQKPVEALWEPVKPAPNFMDKLKQTTKDIALYAVLSMVLFYWQQTGKIEYTTAWWALLVCVGMVFFAVGKNWRVNK